MNAVREAWTDERLDDFRGSVDTGFAQMREDHADFRGDLKGLGSGFRTEMEAQRIEFREEMNGQRLEFRTDMKALRLEFRADMKAQGVEFREEMKVISAELRQETRELREEMHAGFDRIDRRFDWLNGTIVAALIGAVLTHFV